jgi:hypothetical protein
MAMGPSPPLPVGSNKLVNLTAPSFPATTVWQQNTTGVDVVAYLGLSGVTQTHIYLNSSASSTNAIDLTTQAPGTVIIPAGWYFSMTYSAGSPTWVWQGL